MISDHLTVIVNGSFKVLKVKIFKAFAVTTFTPYVSIFLCNAHL